MSPPLPSPLHLTLSDLLGLLPTPLSLPHPCRAGLLLCFAERTPAVAQFSGASILQVAGVDALPSTAAGMESRAGSLNREGLECERAENEGPEWLSGIRVRTLQVRTLAGHVRLLASTVSHMISLADVHYPTSVQVSPWSPSKAHAKLSEPTFKKNA